MDTNKFLTELKRGVSEIISEEELKVKLSRKTHLRVKFGVDPTAADLHLGHTVLLKKLRFFQDNGHKVIFIIGDLTARIGDPSGQTKTRPMISEKEILENAKTYQEQVFKILDKEKTEIVYNSHWLYPLGLQGLLELSKNVTVAQMLHRADFKERFKNDVDITILEFLYPLIQGYDSVAIKADIELGGTDQKFNLLMGREIQRAYAQEPQVVIMMPLLIGTDGVRKMSKSYGNYIALNDTPKDMYGKIMSLPDNLMPDYFELLTDFDMTEIKKLIKNDPRNAKAKLAYTITGQYHGKEQAQKAQQEFDRVFSKKEIPEEIPEFKTNQKEWLPVELIFKAGLVSTKNEARRLLAQGGVEINGEKIKENQKITSDKELIIKVGKRKFCKIIL